jgi:dipeptidyl aminopeptidase/acylaminoacyl peptidase
MSPRVWSGPAAILLIGCLMAGRPSAVSDSAPYLRRSPNADATWTPEVALRIRRVAHVQVSPDARRVAFVVANAVTDGESSEWVSQIHVAAADGSGARPVTAGRRSSGMPRWSPDGQWLAFLSSVRGRPQIYRLALSGGDAEQLTGERGEILEFDWSADGTSFAFLMTDARSAAEEKAEREKRDVRVVGDRQRRTGLYVLPLRLNAEGGRSARRLTPPDLHVASFHWAPDGRSLAIAHADLPDAFEQTDLSIVDAATGMRQVVRRTLAMESDPHFSPDGTTIAFVQGDAPPRWAFNGRVSLVRVSGGDPTLLAPTLDEQPAILGWTADGLRVVVGEARRTVDAVVAVPIDGSAAVDLSAAERDVNEPALNRSGTAVGFNSSTLDQPPEAFASRIDRFNPVQVSRAQLAQRWPPLAQSEIISWTGADGWPIEGILTYPTGYRPGTRVPLLVVIHGGPASVWKRSFIGAAMHFPVATLAAHGYAVLRPNPRGSSGYGRRFREAVIGDWAGSDHRDVLAGVDHLVGSGVADPAKLGVMGWSYGGYLAAWIVTQTDRFKAACVGAGATDLVSYTGTADAPGYLPFYLGSEPWQAEGLWRARSPITHIGRVSTPTLILHGEVDPRVPIGQAYELHTALVRRKVPVQMAVYPRQGHTIQEPKLLEDAMARVVAWFDRWLRGQTP